MFSLGPGELLLIAIVLIVFVGPEKLPSAARKVGQGLRSLRKQTDEITRTIEQDTDLGGAVKELRSALRGDPEPVRPKAPLKTAPPPSEENSHGGDNLPPNPEQPTDEPVVRAVEDSVARVKGESRGAGPESPDLNTAASLDKDRDTNGTRQD